MLRSHAPADLLSAKENESSQENYHLYVAFVHTKRLDQPPKENTSKIAANL